MYTHTLIKLYTKDLCALLYTCHTKTFLNEEKSLRILQRDRTRDGEGKIYPPTSQAFALLKGNGKNFILRIINSIITPSLFGGTKIFVPLK